MKVPFATNFSICCGFSATFVNESKVTTSIMLYSRNIFPVATMVLVPGAHAPIAPS